MENGRRLGTNFKSGFPAVCGGKGLCRLLEGGTPGVFDHRGVWAFSIIVEFVDFPFENAYTDSIEKEAILSVMCTGRATRGGIDTKENERKAACYGFSGFWRFWGPRGSRPAT